MLDVFVPDGIMIGAGDVRYLAPVMTVATLCSAPAAYASLATNAGFLALWSALFVFMIARLIGLGLRYRVDHWLVTGAIAT